MNSCVYMHIFPNGKRYIGVAAGSARKRWGPNGCRYYRQPAIWNAIQKYGWDNVEHIIVKSGLSHSEALSLEAELIKEYKTFPPSLGYGYNATSGGEERTPTDEARERISQHSKMMWSDDRHRARMSEVHKEIARSINAAQYLRDYAAKYGHPNLNRHLSEEHRRNLSKARKGRVPWNTGKTLSPEHRAKLSAIRKGKKQSEELVKKRAAACSRKVMCVETGIIYDSQRAAANAVGVFETAISKCVLGTRKTAGGYHWVRV